MSSNDNGWSTGDMAVAAGVGVAIGAGLGAYAAHKITKEQANEIIEKLSELSESKFRVQAESFNERTNIYEAQIKEYQLQRDEALALAEKA